MSKQVLDVQQMRHLHEMGLDTSNASMLYCDLYDEEYILVESKHRFDKEENAILLEGVINSVIYCKTVTPAYTLQDVLDALPNRIYDKGAFYLGCYDIMIDEHDICYAKWCGAEIESTYVAIEIKDNLIDAAYKMLCWCIEQGYVETDKNE